MNILVVDDDDVIRDELEELLSADSHKVETADSGEVAKEMLKGKSYDIMFTDLKMPGISGIELLSHVKSVNPTTFSVVITGYATIDTAIEAMKEGAYDYIPKPFKMDQLREIITSVSRQAAFEDSVKRKRGPLDTKGYENAYTLFGEVIEERPGLCISRYDPSVVKQRCPSEEIVHIWLTPSARGEAEIHPQNLYGLRTKIESYLEENPNGAVFIDGAEVFLEYHKWEGVRQFMSRLSEAILSKDARLVISINPTNIEEEVLQEMRQLVSGRYIQLMSDSIANPLRREILRFLARRKMASFSEILNELQLEDSPKLSFHLRKLLSDSIISKDKKKHYSLTLRGNRIIDLLVSLEEEGMDDSENIISLTYSS